MSADPSHRLVRPMSAADIDELQADIDSTRQLLCETLDRMYAKADVWSTRARTISIVVGAGGLCVILLWARHRRRWG